MELFLLLATLVSLPTSSSGDNPNKHSLEDAEDASFFYSKDFKAIIGGVLGFWGGVWFLGLVFMVALMAQKYCCDTGQRKDDID